jgi:hypothetical protein
MPPIVGVLREPEFSPGRVEDDAAILERTASALRRRGFDVRVGSTTLLAQDADAVLAMCQSDAALAALDRHAARVAVINAPRAIRNCHRRVTARLLARAGVPFPPTRFVDVRDGGGAAPCWVKRADVHAMHPDDVIYAPSDDQLASAFAGFAARGISEVAVQEDVAGTVVKFYGLADGNFFRCYTETADVPAPIPVLWEVARAAAAALALDVFGGDLVVPPDGRPVVIDVNDWPSFARCRDEAAEAIADYVHRRLRRTDAASRSVGA